ncbi:class I SAM-dependent methyltransferase [Candidatus Latescibacterota bacterium]
MKKSYTIKKEAGFFDKQAMERMEHGFVPDLRRLTKVDWFYNNVWRDPEFAKIQWMPRINNIIKHAKESGTRTVEIGCGLGMLSLELARNGLDVLGIDISHESIAIAEKYKEENTYQEGFGSLEYKCENLLNLELEKETFDSVIFFRSLHHMPEPDKILEKVSEILKPKGKVILSEPVRSHFTMESAHFAALLRVIAPTWEPYSKKLKKKWNEENWKKDIQAVFDEYVYHGKHAQSPLDNSTNNAETLINIISEKFVICEETYSDAFVDKLIGGLRGEYKYELARFLKFLDTYMIENKLLPPTSLELVAQKT